MRRTQVFNRANVSQAFIDELRALQSCEAKNSYDTNCVLGTTAVPEVRLWKSLRYDVVKISIKHSRAACIHGTRSKHVVHHAYVIKPIVATFVGSTRAKHKPHIVHMFIMTIVVVFFQSSNEYLHDVPLFSSHECLKHSCEATKGRSY